jgi:hypothetical protein
MELWILILVAAAIAAILYVDRVVNALPSLTSFFDVTIHQESNNGDVNPPPEYQGEYPMSVRITLGKARLVTLTPKDASGQPTVLDGQVVWTSSDEDVVSIQPVEGSNGLSAHIIGTGIGFSYVTASGDADLDPDEERIIAFESEFTITRPEAIELVGEIGDEVDVPPPTPPQTDVDTDTEVVPTEG